MFASIALGLTELSLRLAVFAALALFHGLRRLARFAFR